MTDEKGLSTQITRRSVTQREERAGAKALGQEQSGWFKDRRGCVTSGGEWGHMFLNHQQEAHFGFSCSLLLWVISKRRKKCQLYVTKNGRIQVHSVHHKVESAKSFAYKDPATSVQQPGP